METKSTGTNSWWLVWLIYNKSIWDAFLLIILKSIPIGMIIKKVSTKALKILVNPSCISPFFAAMVRLITSIEL